MLRAAGHFDWPQTCLERVARALLAKAQRQERAVQQVRAQTATSVPSVPTQDPVSTSA